MALELTVNSGLSLQHHLSNFQLSYRSTPSSLFLHRHIRTRLNLIRPDFPSRVLAEQVSMIAELRNKNSL